jgi:formate hydrogenlyase subunit 3/multisubunit Na+/H+ antiporter MnhD subunit
MHHMIEPLLGFLFIGGALSALGSLLALIFWVWMLIDAIKNPRLQGNQRIVWVLVIILVPCLGSLIYFFAGRSG